MEPECQPFRLEFDPGQRTVDTDVPTAYLPRAGSRGIADGLPSTFISTGALDLFLEEDLEYARRLNTPRRRVLELARLIRRVHTV